MLEDSRQDGSNITAYRMSVCSLANTCQMDVIHAAWVAFATSGTPGRPRHKIMGQAKRYGLIQRRRSSPTLRPGNERRGTGCAELFSS